MGIVAMKDNRTISMRLDGLLQEYVERYGEDSIARMMHAQVGLIKNKHEDEMNQYYNEGTEDVGLDDDGE